MRTNPDLTKEQQAEWQKLAKLARDIEDKLGELELAVLQADIADDCKPRIFDWVSRAETFRGLAYHLTPQSEWLGGSDDSAKWAVRLPHIARPSIYDK